MIPNICSTGHRCGQIKNLLKTNPSHRIISIAICSLSRRSRIFCRSLRRRRRRRRRSRLNRRRLFAPAEVVVHGGVEIAERFDDDVADASVAAKFESAVDGNVRKLCPSSLLLDHNKLVFVRGEFSLFTRKAFEVLPYQKT